MALYDRQTGGGQGNATVVVEADGAVTLRSSTFDQGSGTHTILRQIVAEELTVPLDAIRVVTLDTDSSPFDGGVGGSRVTHSAGMATIQAARDAIDKMRDRAAEIWGIDVEAVVWDNGHAKPAGSNAGEFDPMSFAEIVAGSHSTGGPIAGHAEINAEGAGNSFGTHVVDVEVDPHTGGVTVLRYLVVQDAGKAVHPSYVEGQYQGGAAQGIGWALNEEYIYGDDGRLQNPGFLDYRMPVCSDLPMLDSVIIEIPNPKHPQGVRGVGEVPLVPSLAAIRNAVYDALGIRFYDLPMSPPKVLEAMETGEAAE